MPVLLLAVVLVDAALVALLALLFQPLYAGPVPLPIGTLLVLALLPRLTSSATEVSAALPVAASPLLVWGIVTGVLGFGGPGDDLLLPGTWQSVLLLVAGTLAGLFSLRRIAPVLGVPAIPRA